MWITIKIFFQSSRVFPIGEDLSAGDVYGIKFKEDWSKLDSYHIIFKLKFLKSVTDTGETRAGFMITEIFVTIPGEITCPSNWL